MARRRRRSRPWVLLIDSVRPTIADINAPAPMRPATKTFSGMVVSSQRRVGDAGRRVTRRVVRPARGGRAVADARGVDARRHEVDVDLVAGLAVRAVDLDRDDPCGAVDDHRRGTALAFESRDEARHVHHGRQSELTGHDRGVGQRPALFDDDRARGEEQRRP